MSDTTRIAFVADCHLGNHRRFGGESVRSLNERCRFAVTAFEQAALLASRHASHLVVAGDLFDSSRPEPQLIAEVLRIVRSHTNGLQFIFLVGNHDQDSDQRGDHALGALAFDAQVIEEPAILNVGDAQMVFLPHSAAAPAPERLARAVEALVPVREGQRRLLVIHAGVADERTPFFLKGAQDSVDVGTLALAMQSKGIEACFAGNWHDQRVWANPLAPVGGHNVFQVGALCPTGFDNPGAGGYGGVAVWSSARPDVQLHTIEGPRFLPLKGPMAWKQIVDAKAAGRKLYVSLTADKDKVSSSIKDLEKLRKEGEIHAFEVLVSAQEAQLAARTAAQSAREAGTLEGALENFVENMPLEEGVPREKVAERSRRYLCDALARPLGGG